MSDPGIVCFQHCGPKIFCHMLPNCCPACHLDLSTATFELLPFRLPYPFVKPHQHPCSIILRPTIGDFMKYVVCRYIAYDLYCYKLIGSYAIPFICSVITLIQPIYILPLQHQPVSLLNLIVAVYVKLPKMNALNYGHKVF